MVLGILARTELQPLGGSRAVRQLGTKGSTCQGLARLLPSPGLGAAVLGGHPEARPAGVPPPVAPFRKSAGAQEGGFGGRVS